MELLQLSDQELCCLMPHRAGRQGFRASQRHLVHNILNVHNTDDKKILERPK